MAIFNTIRFTGSNLKQQLKNVQQNNQKQQTETEQKELTSKTSVFSDNKKLQTAASSGLVQTARKDNNEKKELSFSKLSNKEKKETLSLFGETQVIGRKVINNAQQNDDGTVDVSGKGRAKVKFTGVGEEAETSKTGTEYRSYAFGQLLTGGQQSAGSKVLNFTLDIKAFDNKLVIVENRNENVKTARQQSANNAAVNAYAQTAGDDTYKEFKELDLGLYDAGLTEMYFEDEHAAA